MSLSAFDVLMAKKSQPQSPKPKGQKRKTPSKSPSPKLRDFLASSSEHQQTVENSSSSPIADAHVENPMDNEPKDGGPAAVKKPKVSISPDESATELKKKGADFEAKRAVYWDEGEPVPFVFVAKALDTVSKETGTLVITEILCNMLRTVMETTPDDLLAIMCLLSNKVLTLGIGDVSIKKVLVEAFGVKLEHIEQQLTVHGDLGLVAKRCRSSQSLLRKPQPLTVAKVFDTFRLIANESGNEKKKSLIKALLFAATDCETLYLIRLLQRSLRIGSAGKTLLTALGHAAAYFDKHSSLAKPANSLEEAAKIVELVYSVNPYDKLIPALLFGGVWDLRKTCSFSPGIPVEPMLAKPMKRVSDIVEKFKGVEFTCEYKYDGERAQIHYMENGSVEIFSRNAKRSTEKFPDVIDAVTRLKKPCAKSFVLDCEIVAFDREKQRILPFQILSTRARKNVAIDEIKVNVCIFAFDILYLNGQLLLQEQLNARREHLYRSFQEEAGFFQFATATTSDDVEEIHKFLDDAVNSSCEGLIIKTLKKDATYETSKRSNNWLKLKKDYMETLGDSLDLVPIAGFYGKGKRVGVYGSFLLACYDSDREEFQSICKIATGFSEAELEELSSRLGSRVIAKPKAYYRCSDKVSPDVWFEPSEVWEVKGSDLTRPENSEVVGIVNTAMGISVRFPRLLRIREDKNPEQASSSDMVADMYNAQKQIVRLVPVNK